jgi:hypothetical protein
VDEGHEPERIEIELTSHDPAGAAARARRLQSESVDGDAGIVAAGEVADGDEPGWLGTERGRLLTVGGVAALIALVVGVLVGRMGSDGVQTSDAPTTEEATTTTTMPGNNDTLPPAPDIQAPPTTRATVAITTTTVIDTDADIEVVEPIAVDPAVPSDPVEVVALTPDGELVRIDIANGIATRSQVVPGGRFNAFGAPAGVHAGTGWILVPALGPDGTSIVIFDDGSRSTLELGGWFPVLVGADGGTVWRVDPDRVTGDLTWVTEIAFDGSETGVAIDVGGHYPQMADPLGGVVVEAPGGYYSVGVEATTRLTDGRLIAVGERRLVVEECDDQLTCGVFVVDRATGDRTPLALDPALGDAAPIEFGASWTIRQPLSPDEDALLIVRWDTSGSGGQTLGVVDLTTGGYTEIGSVFDLPQAAWSPDGERVFWLDARYIKVFDRATGESVLLSPGLDAFAALAVRPSAGATADTTTDG